VKIYIPTYGRSDRQVTWENLPYTIQQQTPLVVQKREEGKYDTSKYPIIVLPEEITSIGPTRQWLIENSASRYMVMMDDDLDFATRRSDDPTRFVAATDTDLHHMLRTIEDSLMEGYKLVGVSGRESANRNTEQFLYASRQLRIHAIDTEFYRQPYSPRFDRVEFMEDFDFLLQLLELGYPNRVCNAWVHNQRGGSNAKGGCSATRTLEKHNQAAKELMRLHPQYVRLVVKNSGNWGGERLDVNVSWKKALRDAR
jgi:hypothetical protein